MSEQTAAKVNISGRVQGVFFRAFTRDNAVHLGLTGYVKNCPDGTVEGLFQGPEKNVAAMIEWCWQGSPVSRVDRVTQTIVTIDPLLTGFDIRY